MLSPIDTRILTARPDHLTAMTGAERAGQALARRRRPGVATLLVGLAARLGFPRHGRLMPSSGAPAAKPGTRI